MFKKILPYMLVFSLVLGAIGATTGTAFAATSEHLFNTMTTTTTSFGASGFSSPNAAFAGEVAVSRFPAADVRGTSDIRFIRPILDLAVADNNKNSTLSSPAFVYFDLTTSQVKDLQDKNLAIYYFNPTTKSWSKLYTWLGKGSNGDRAVADVKGFGWYALGIMKPTTTS